MSEAIEQSAKRAWIEVATLREQVAALRKERDALQYHQQSLINSAKVNREGLQEQLATLAEQNEKMREALRLARFDSLNMTLAGWEKLKEAAVLPDLATPVLNRIRADGMRMAAQFIEDKYDFLGEEITVADEIRARADELEKAND